MRSDSCVLAAAQTVPVAGDVDANLECHLRLVRAAAEQGARCVVFPELSLTGYEIARAPALAFTPDDRRLAPLADAAAACDTMLVVGAPVRLESGLHIGALIVAPDRTITIYTKHHLGAFSEAARVDGTVPPAEATAFQPGDRNPLVPLGDATAAVAVCADTGRPAHPRAAAARGASAYLASMFVIPSELARETGHLARYAAEHRMAVVFANYGGPSGGLASAGRSAIWSGDGRCLAALAGTGEGLVSAAVTLEPRLRPG